MFLNHEQINAAPLIAKCHIQQLHNDNNWLVQKS